MRADGVFSGGGIKGLAFAGALQAAEEAGYEQWVNLAGTSAGAITAMALAVGYDAKGLRELLSFDFSKIDDRGGPFGLGVIANYFKHGITRGAALTAWIEGLLRNAPAPASTFGELDGRLKVVGSDLVHSRMVVFPDDVVKYLDPNGTPYVPDEFSVATAVRISAGYPGFFPPIPLTDAATRKDGALVDGGITSAFPVFLFDHQRPKHPTWAFRLYGGSPPEQPPNKPIDGLLWPIAMIEDVIDTATSALDDFELRSFGNRVIAIPTGSVSTLNFSLTEQERKFLFESGYTAAKQFFASPDPTNRFGERPPTQDLQRSGKDPSPPARGANP
jgi:NTE family protein